ncbi:MAG TPA: hypothetical protein VFQ12_12040, partial [Thermoleophilaceae bacterium]|nr:hypothetical protein [Thermoleophilaceae bacterium]
MAPETATQAWHVDASRFPGDGSDEDQLEFALRYAILAPSGHNTQPWRFRIRGDTVEVHADRMRALAIVDPAGRELVISCGAALFLLRLALRRFHHAPEVALLPEPGEPTLLARVALGQPVEPTRDEAALAEA